ncbi:hypothetical protein NEUTE1DRAFT_92393 [Neurospora tetrasperma FGSC 2508]|uniref:Endoplasmic reticulum junction formation protein lunapark n=1 Tax=Neurospora tetrasperma (strain FGSC 2508 / ATCC MYA-4615 / P0657) TaxID=510951 RepID=F8N287_NEUT8|nr:uncharacterized protein NEUTE1DRAFT_92393 [Neurospora tetrasperma FGSC 2508]EGO53258.1 hypothetical protein NEUTE1DRAFT_92393 [Neurospora tetrasperma FGSC 2508]
MVSLWPWKKEDSSPASFEKALSALSGRITVTQTRLDNVRSTARRVKGLATLYLGFAYLVYAIVALLVIGWKNMGPQEWTGMAGGPVIIYLVRTLSTMFFDYRINGLNAKLEYLQTERAKTIQKLKDATRYDSTLELLEKYGGPENKIRRRASKKGGDDDNDEDGAQRSKKSQGRHANRIHIAPPPTANIQRPGAVGPNMPQPGAPPRGQQLAPSPMPPHGPELSAEFAPNAFETNPRASPAPPHAQYPLAAAAMAAPTESHWYDRILDTLIGEDETAAKNRIVLICKKCRLVNGQAPPGTKSLSEIGKWKCMSCGAVNGEMDEGKRIVREVIGGGRSEESLVHSQSGDDATSLGSFGEEFADEELVDRSEAAESDKVQERPEKRLKTEGSK